jgi:type I restriction-modification system DNA methylase subunit
MARTKSNGTASSQSSATIGFEAKLWLTADKMRNNMDAAEYTRRLAAMNLALRGIEADFGPEHADTFRNVQHPDLRADFVIANALRDSASNPSKPNPADGERPTTTFFQK